MTTITPLRPRNWLHASTGLVVWLPCDKRLFRVVSRDTGADQALPRFRSLRAAAAFLDRLAT
jgi:hypothetical protein